MWFSPTPTTNSQQRAFARNIDFLFIILGSERTFTFRVLMVNTIIFKYFDLNQIQVHTVTHNSIQSILAHSHILQNHIGICSISIPQNY